MTDTLGMLTASFGLLIAILGLVAWIARAQGKANKPIESLHLWFDTTQMAHHPKKIEAH